MSLFSNENVPDSAQLGNTNRAQNEEIVSIINLAAASTANQDIWVAPPQSVWQVTGIQATFGVTSTSGTVMLQRCQGTTAAGSGTNLLTGAVSLSGTANTPVVGTLISNPVTLTLNGSASPSAGGGDRLTITLAGTLTGLADCLVQVRLKRIGPAGY